MSRMQNEIKMIDKDNDGKIQLSEWLDYILPFKMGAEYDTLDFIIRQLFDKSDGDKNGEISELECSSIIEFIIKRDVTGLAANEKMMTNETLQYIAHNIMSVYDTEHSASLNVMI